MNNLSDEQKRGHEFEREKERGMSMNVVGKGRNDVIIF